MALWLYQLTHSDESTLRSYPIEDYRREIWENEPWRWPVGNVVGAEGGRPRPGDQLVMFYSPSAAKKEAGFYGWAVVLEWRAHDECPLFFRPVSPSDRLKMHPWGDTAALDLARAAKPGNMGTLFLVPPDIARQILEGIANWTGGHCAMPTEPQATQA